MVCCLSQNVDDGDGNGDDDVDVSDAADIVKRGWSGGGVVFWQCTPKRPKTQKVKSAIISPIGSPPSGFGCGSAACILGCPAGRKNGALVSDLPGGSPSETQVGEMITLLHLAPAQKRPQKQGEVGILPATSSMQPSGSLLHGGT